MSTTIAELLEWIRLNPMPDRATGPQGAFLRKWRRKGQRAGVSPCCVEFALSMVWLHTWGPPDLQPVLDAYSSLWRPRGDQGPAPCPACLELPATTVLDPGVPLVPRIVYATWRGCGHLADAQGQRVDLEPWHPTRQDLAQTHCPDPAHDGAAIGLESRCHPGAPTRASYQAGQLTLVCAVCAAPVLSVDVR